MKKKLRAIGHNWEFDGSMIAVRIPMVWKRRGGRKVIIAPSAKPRPDETLIRVLARAHRWKRMLEEGGYRSAGGIADAEKINRSFVNRLLRLTLLAPDIQEAILDGRQPKAMQLGELIRAMPSSWKKQRELLTLPSVDERGAAPDAADLLVDLRRNR